MTITATAIGAITTHRRFCLLNSRVVPGICAAGSTVVGAVARLISGVVDVGGRIRLDGQEIRTGDLLHGDLNGIVIVPTELVKDLPAEVEKIRTREAGFLQYINSPEFNLDDYKGMVGY